MSKARLVDQSGAATGSVELPGSVFDVEVNQTVMHQAVLRQLANRRQGTHQTLTRGKVSGGGRKPYRQKGTGRARQGSIRAPHYTGGGVVFGPHPRGYRLEMPRKQRRLALRSALTTKARDDQIIVLGDIELEAPRTRTIAALLRAVEAGRRVLLVLGTHNQHLEKSARNLPEVQVTLAGNVSVRDLLIADTVLVTRDALEHMVEAWS